MHKIAIIALNLTLCTLLFGQELTVADVLILQNPDRAYMEEMLPAERLKKVLRVIDYFSGDAAGDSIDQRAVLTVLDTLKKGKYYLEDEVSTADDFYKHLLSSAKPKDAKNLVSTPKNQREELAAGTAAPLSPGTIAADILEEIIEEEVIDLAVHYLEAELQKFAEVDSLFEALFPKVSQLLARYSSTRASSVFLHHLHKNMQSDLDELGSGFLEVLHRKGKLNREQFELGLFIRNRLRHFNFDGSWLNIAYHARPTPALSFAFMLNRNLGLPAGSLPGPGLLGWLETNGIPDFYRRWMQLGAEQKALYDNSAMVDRYFEGWEFFENFLLNVSNTGRPDLYRDDYIQAFLAWGRGDLTPAELGELEEVLQIISDFEIDFRQKKLDLSGIVFDMAALLGLQEYPTLMMIAHLAMQPEEQEFKRSLASVYIPHSNYQSLRKEKTTLLVMAYLGAGVGYESILSKDNNPGAGLHLSTALLAGPGVIFGTGGWSHTLFLQMLDIGAPFSMIISDLGGGSRNSFNEKIQLESMVSPGISYLLGIKNIPVSVGLGMSIQADGRQLGDGYENTHRINLGIYMDIPVFTVKQFDN